MSALMLGNGELSFKTGVKELGARALQPYLRVNNQITSLKFEVGDLSTAGLRILVETCANSMLKEELRTFALEALLRWSIPMDTDPVLGHYRPTL